MLEHRQMSHMDSGDFGWLKVVRHFDVENTACPKHPPLGALHVWNDDDFAPGTGLPIRAHRDVEIITYVREGAMFHVDSFGNDGKIEAGDVQVVSAGSGIEHGETSILNCRTKIFQICFSSNTPGSKPERKTGRFLKNDRLGRFVVLASCFKDDVDAIAINAEARLSAAILPAGETLVYELQRDRKAYLVSAGGQIIVNDVTIDTSDGIAIFDEQSLHIKAVSSTEIILAELV